ncbi:MULTISPECIES: hypothetical protein [unclassified Actinobaculum]|uniref:hypothetical protein n=1 Tax=unclassified Actinobaculum TaxID=2609299 RepID=UPI000D5295AA|nr:MULTISPECIES: hypothetical protein [unclassified Actinobaculum]AWE43009.1 hypothetical protein DDD63_09970 [Actinobaculum sp. 313]RTE48606.1 hypothetical protein EKN07_09630 [Actinobaculum sp. 352]
MAWLIIVVTLLAAVFIGWVVVEVVLHLARVSDNGNGQVPRSGGHAATVLPQEERPVEVLRGGTWIGVLERIAIAGCILAGQPGLVAAVVAIKGLGRWADLQSNPALTERFIIGTLASYIVAASCGFAGVWLLGA